MSPLNALIIFSLIILLTFTSTYFTSAAAAKPKRLLAKLVHRDSLLIHNPRDTIEARAERILNTSIVRFNYFSQKASKAKTITTHDLQAQLHPGAYSYVFYVNFSIGDPPVPQLAVMDSGSSLIWVQCQSCDGRCNTRTKFDPSKSSTYFELPCDASSLCINDCNLFPDECAYRIGYINGPDSLGKLATERFTFKTSDEDEIVVNDVTFGCSLSNINSESEERYFNGVFGIGNENPTMSLVQKFGSTFSYCIGNLQDPEYAHNMLRLGEGAILEGDPTPVDVINGFYYVNLEGISIGEKLLDIDPNIFKRSRSGRGKNGVCIDSGTPLTWLPRSAFQAVRRKIEDLSEGVLTRSSEENRGLYLCFSGKASRDLEGFPVMAFHFAGGADLVVDAETMFFQASETEFCLAVAPSDYVDREHENQTIIGVIAQQSYNVAFDLVENQMYLQRIDCELLID